VKPLRLVVVRYRTDRHKWEVDYRVPTPAGTKRCRPLFDDEESATQHAAQITKKLNDGLPVMTADKDILLRDYGPQWLEARKGIIATHTYMSYRDLLKNYVVPKLGHLKVRQISTAYLLPWLSSLKAKGLSTNTIRLSRAALSSLIGYAILQGITEENPLLHLSKQKGAQIGKITKSEQDEKIRPFESPEQFERVLAVALPPRYAPWGRCWEVMARCGLRPGEALALKPGDLDLVAKTLRVERALDHGGLIKDTKTHERRVVRLSDTAVLSLKKHLHWLKQETLKRGWGEAAWLFPHESNQPLKVRTGQRLFPLLCRRAGVPEHSMYDLRHSYATWMLQAGAPLGYVSKQLGHKNPATTLKFYYHWVKSDDRDQAYANALERGLEPNAGTKTGQRAVSHGSASDLTGSGALSTITPRTS